MSEREQVIAEFGNKKVLVVGDVMLDRYIYGKVDRVSPEAPVPVVRWQEEERKLGGAGNVALNLKALGADVDLCGVLQADEAGSFIRKRLEEVGIGDRTLGIHNERNPRCVWGPTITKTRIVANGQQVCRVDREKPVLDGKDEVLLDFSGYDVIFVSDYAKGLVDAKLMMQVSSSKVPFYCDPKHKELGLYAGASGITPNEKEATEFVFPYPNEDLIVNLERCGIASCLMTRGELGVMYWETGWNLPYRHEPHKRELADACGAGDTAFAVYGLSKTCGASTEQSAWLANLAASLVCEHFGVVPITRMQLVAALAEGE